MFVLQVLEEVFGEFAFGLEDPVGEQVVEAVEQQVGFPLSSTFWISGWLIRVYSRA